MILLDLLDQCMKLSSILFWKCASLCSGSLVDVWWVWLCHHMTILSFVWRLVVSSPDHTPASGDSLVTVEGFLGSADSALADKCAH